MEIKRFFAPQSALINNTITIDGDEYYHLFKVLRHKVGFKIIVSLEDGKDYYCTIIGMAKDFCEARVDEIKENPCISDVKITLFQALPKGNKIDLIIQKCVELGVSKIVPFMSQYVNEDKFNLERSRKISIEASKQSCRSIKCEIEDLINFKDMLNYLKEFDLVILPYEKATFGRLGEIKGLRQAKNIAYIIGSEGGFTDSEVKNLEDEDAKIISLGSQILRTETAAIITAALISYEIS